METQNKRTITIDLKKNTLIKKPKFIQNDTNIIEFIVQENGVSSDLTNVGRIVVNYLRPDKQIITKFIEDSKVANKVTYNLGVTETEGDGGVGEAELEITFYSIDNTQRISIKRMGLEIIDSIGEGTLNNNEDYTLLQELLVDVDTAITQAETATNNAQNLVDTSIHLGDYNSTTDYVVNNEVHYNGSTYRCILGSTGNEPTNTTYWTLVASKGEQGIQGVQGVQGEQGIQGERGLNWKGAYNNTITYIVNDGVSYNGSSYVCIQDTTAGILPTDTNYFNLLAQKGADGTGSGTVTSVNNISPDVSGDVILTANDVGALPIEDSHSHTNKSSLDRLGVDESNNLTIDDIAYESGASIDDVTPSTTTVWSSQKTSNEISVLSTDLGDKTTLTTTEKSNLVGAISEVKDDIVRHLAEIVTVPTANKILRMDSKGQNFGFVTRCSISHSLAQTFGSSWALVSFDTALFANDSMASTANRITINTAGYYRAIFIGYCDGTQAGRSVQIIKNSATGCGGGSLPSIIGGGVLNAVIADTGIIYLNAGDYLTVQAASVGATAGFTANGVLFSIVKVGD